MKKLVLVAFSLVLLSLPALAHADEENVSVTPKVGMIKKIEQKIEEKKEQVANKLLKGAARIANAKVTAVNGSTLTVTANGKTYTVTTDKNTKCVRHFWGACTVSDIAVNDQLNIWGVYSDDAKTTIQAKMIRDLSQMKRFGAFLGNITSLGNGSFVMQSKERGNQTVFYTSSTKFVNRKGQTIAITDLKTGDRARVKGTWDKSNNTVTETTEVKDFSLPTPTSSK